MDKIAFMFLLYDKIQHQKLWEDFFSEDPVYPEYPVFPDDPPNPGGPLHPNGPLTSP